MQKEESKPSQWSISCPLIILGLEEDKVIAAIPIKFLISLWLRPLKFASCISTIQEATRSFKAYFKLEAELEKEALKLIDDEMKEAL